MLGKSFLSEIAPNKNILIIGNKQLTHDYSELLNSYKIDIVCRINGCDNYNETKNIKDTDILLCDIWSDSVTERFKSKSYYEKILADSKCIINFFEHNSYHRNTIVNSWTNIHNLSSKIYSVPFNNYYINKYIPESENSLYDENTHYRIRNSIWMIIFMLENFRNNKIYTFGIDKHNRQMIPCSINHTQIYTYEERFLNDCYDNNLLTYISD